MVAITSTDMAGNTATSTQAVTIDTATSISAGIAAESDSGVSNSDHITNVTTPIITGIGEAGSTVVITEGNVTIGTATIASDGTYSITSPHLIDGTHDFTITSIDSAGNIATSQTSLMVDTMAPTAATLSLENNTGSNTSDQITSDTTVKVTGMDATSTWEYSTDAGQNWNTGTNDSFELSQNNTYAAGDIQVKTIDSAGNEALTSMDSVTTDHLANDVTLTLSADANVELFGLEPTSTWEYSADNGQNWATGSSDSFELQSGTYVNDSIHVKTTDLAGNETTALIDEKVIIGTNEDDTITAGINDTINGGEGNDTLNIVGNGEFSIDFDKISNIETINVSMDNNTSDTFNLNLTSILADPNQANEIIIKGETGDTLALTQNSGDTSSWTVSSKEVNGEAFTVLENSQLTILVDETITISGFEDVQHTS